MFMQKLLRKSGFDKIRLTERTFDYIFMQEVEDNEIDVDSTHGSQPLYLSIF